MASMTDFDDTADALAAMSVREIRRAQDIVAAQIPIAFHQENTGALRWLQEAETQYTNELMRRLDAGII